MLEQTGSTPLNIDETDAARDGVAELPQWLSFVAKAAVVLHVHFCAAVAAF